MKTGKIYLVGAGPGDPDLITVKGLECIKESDVIVYDYLAAPELLKYAKEGAELIYVGKKGGNHTLSQDGINKLLVEKGKEGHTVARLKGGDSFIFGRGGEEAEVLVEAKIPFEVVPGVTSLIAAPAYAGIPLTHRSYASTVAFVTGHEDPTKESSDIDWAALAKGIGTIVFAMGVKNLPNITQRLMDNGMSPDTPTALVRRGTTTSQATVSGTLSNIVEKVTEAGIKAPAVIVVGKVVNLRETMKWFEDKRPLMGKKVVVTRARAQASALVNSLRELGAGCFECPTIKTTPPDDWAPLDTALENISDYQWIIFTSVNGVRYFFQRLFDTGKDVRSLGFLRTAAIGPATAKTLMEFGISIDIIPKTYRAESVVEAFQNEKIKGKKILLPRAKEARPIIPVELTKMGAKVDEITTYRTKPVSDKGDQLISELEAGNIHMVTFTSSSTVKNFHALLPPKNMKKLMKNVTVASIGPITTDTAKELGFDVDITAESFTIAGLCQAISDYYK